MRNGFKDLIVYQKSVKLSLMIFKISRTFPKEETYSLTDQVRRSSRSIGANIAEAWPKRRYPKAFIAKLIDAQSEGCETIHWLDQSLMYKYINKNQHTKCTELLNEVQKMLTSMIKQPEKFCNNQ